MFPQKTNVNFAQIIDATRIKLVTWERGVGLSMACGTGACATAIAAYLNSKTKRDVTVELGMGSLFISWGKNNTVYMTGPRATTICTGKILL